MMKYKVYLTSQSMEFKYRMIDLLCTGLAERNDIITIMGGFRNLGWMDENNWGTLGGARW